MNGRYLGSGEEYIPLRNMPVIANVFIGISTIGGYFFAGIFGLLIGLLFGILVLSKAGSVRENGRLDWSVCRMYVGSGGDFYDTVKIAA